MRKFLLTTALVIPLSGMAFAQTATTTPETAAEMTADTAAAAADAAADTATDAANEAADAAAMAEDSAAEAAGDAADAAADATAAETMPAADAAATSAEIEADAEAAAADAAESAEAAEAEALQAEMATSDKIAREQAGNELRVDWVTGANVTSPDGTAVGQVRDIIVDADSGQMIAAIIGVGGFLGIGEKQIAVPWEQLTINYDAQEITSELTQDEAKAAPEYVFRQRKSAPAAAPVEAMPAAADPAAMPADPAASADPAAPAPAN